MTNLKPESSVASVQFPILEGKGWAMVSCRPQAGSGERGPHEESLSVQKEPRWMHSSSAPLLETQADAAFQPGILLQRTAGRLLFLRYRCIVFVKLYVGLCCRNEQQRKATGAVFYHGTLSSGSAWPGWGSNLKTLLWELLVLPFPLTSFPCIFSLSTQMHALFNLLSLKWL